MRWRIETGMGVIAPLWHTIAFPASYIIYGNALMHQSASEYFGTAVADGSYRGFLAVDSTGKTIGGGGIVISSWPGILGQRRPQRAMILNMYVDRDHRRRGVGRALMEAMITWCRENDFASVGLHASDEGRGLYEQLGFKPTTEMRLVLT
jgi:GNAT superfamily N-acetyltransferase